MSCILSCTDKPPHQIFYNTEVYDMEDNVVSISSIISHNELSLISMWATWCVPCKKQLNELQKVYPSWKKTYNLEIVAVNVDQQKNHQKAIQLIQDKGWQFVMLFDKKEKLAEKLSLRGIPYSILIDKSGNILHTIQGFSENFEQEIENAVSKL